MIVFEIAAFPIIPVDGSMFEQIESRIESRVALVVNVETDPYDLRFVELVVLLRLLTELL